MKIYTKSLCARAGALDLYRELSAVMPAGTITHLIFTDRQANTWEGPARHGALRSIRLIVPTDQVQAIGRRMLSGYIDLPEGSEPARASLNEIGCGAAGAGYAGRHIRSEPSRTTVILLGRLGGNRVLPTHPAAQPEA
jgi:hypothetical protein